LSQTGFHTQATETIVLSTMSESQTHKLSQIKLDMVKQKADNKLRYQTMTKNFSIKSAV